MYICLDLLVQFLYNVIHKYGKQNGAQVTSLSYPIAGTLIPYFFLWCNSYYSYIGFVLLLPLSSNLSNTLCLGMLSNAYSKSANAIYTFCSSFNFFTIICVCVKMWPSVLLPALNLLCTSSSVGSINGLSFFIYELFVNVVFSKVILLQLSHWVKLPYLYRGKIWNVLSKSNNFARAYTLVVKHRVTKFFLFLLFIFVFLFYFTLVL